jgi:hypothetical protein
MAGSEIQGIGEENSIIEYSSVKQRKLAALQPADRASRWAKKISKINEIIISTGGGGV